MQLMQHLIASSVGGRAPAPVVEDVFSTTSFIGSASADVTVVNGVDLTGSGGLLWVKSLTAATNHLLMDTLSPGFYMSTNSTAAAVALAGFTPKSNGFTLAAGVTATGATYNAWTFGRAKRFFDVVRYTGDGAGDRYIPHNLGIAPGLIMVKNLSTGDWVTYHRSFQATGYVLMNGTSPFVGTSSPPRTSGDESTMSVHQYPTTWVENTAGANYVAYLFAHDPAPDGVIQCGFYVGNGATIGPDVNLGWEPQYIMVKNLNAISSWVILDTARQLGFGGADDEAVFAGATTIPTASVQLASTTPTGFRAEGTNANVNTSGATYIYMAIRRAPERDPTSGTQVFNAVQSTGTASRRLVSGVGFQPDATFSKITSTGNASDTSIFDKLRGSRRSLFASTTAAETTNSIGVVGFHSDGLVLDTGAPNTSGYPWTHYCFRRAAGVFDIITWTGDGGSGLRHVPHTLKAMPELVITKSRSGVGNWQVATANGYNAFWNSPAAGIVQYPLAGYVTDTYVEPIGIAVDSTPNVSGVNYVAYLFASKAGISKVGNYTGNGTSAQFINCGFAAGARFVMIKRLDVAGEWLVWDRVHGMDWTVNTENQIAFTNNTSFMMTESVLNATPGGFSVRQATSSNINVAGATYLYLAFA